MGCCVCFGDMDSVLVVLFGLVMVFELLVDSVLFYAEVDVECDSYDEGDDTDCYKCYVENE